ncbi:MAG: FtsX-like permease family protein [Gemmatimonadaceae bacterium]
MANLELGIAWRYLRSRRGSKLLSLISVIAIGGVLVGVSALIVIMGVMNGLQQDLQEKILVGSPDIRIMTYDDGMRMKGWKPIIEKSLKVPGVTKGAPFLQTQGIAKRVHGTAQGVAIVGILSEEVPGADVTSIRSKATFGNFKFLAPDGSKRGAVLGEILASKLNAYPGDTLELTGASDDIDAITGSPKRTDMTVVVSGVFSTGLYEYDATYMYLDLSAAQQFSGFGDDITGIELQLKDRWQSRLISDTLEAVIKEGIRAVDWQEQNRPLFQALKLEKLGMGVILLLIVVIAAFNIVSTLTMVVSDKTREIGILRAMGLPAKSIRKVFVYQGMVIGAIGTLGGLLLGLIVVFVMVKLEWPKLDQQIYFIDHVPVIVAPLDVILVAVASMIIATVATLYPAAQAAKLYPVDAIRHE